MGDIGIKISRKGFDLDDCADHQLVFSSSFPTLMIHSSGTFDFNGVTLDQIVSVHGLGYAPIFMVFITSDQGDGWYSNGDSRLSYPGNSQFFRVDDTDLTFFASEIGGSVSISGRYYIFRRNIEQNFSYTNVDTTETAPNIQENYGIKISKEGYSIDSEDGRDYLIDSSKRQLLIHTQKYQDIVGPAVMTTEHNLGYHPIYLHYIKDVNSDGRWQQYSNADDSYVASFTDRIETTVLLSKRVASIVLKDWGIN